MTEQNTTGTPEATEGISETLGTAEGPWAPASPSEVEEDPVPGRDEVSGAQEPQPEEADDATEDPDEPDDGHDSDPRLTKARREAQRLRQRAKDAEAEVSALREQVARHNAAEVARHAERLGLRDGGDLLLDPEVEVEALLTDGAVNPQKVADAVDVVLERHPGWRAPTLPRGARPGGPAEGQSVADWVSTLRSGSASGDGAGAADWSQVLRR